MHWSDSRAGNGSRLLRNRVSAQQARERKKRYITDLEQQLQDKESELDSVKLKMQDVTSDNMTLRRLITTMRGASTPPQHPANSSCTPCPAPSPSPHQARDVPSTRRDDTQDHQAHTWHISEVLQSCITAYASVPACLCCFLFSCDTQRVDQQRTTSIRAPQDTLLTGIARVPVQAFFLAWNGLPIFCAL